MNRFPWRPYRSYLLRLWREYDEGKLRWRAAIESVQTSEVHRFTCLDDLFLFIENQMSQADTVYEMEVVHWFLKDLAEE
ncbi:MAG: hypothetical protein AAF702_31880 [Chloroflexota bacterium]